MEITITFPEGPAITPGQRFRWETISWYLHFFQSLENIHKKVCYYNFVCYHKVHIIEKLNLTGFTFVFVKEFWKFISIYLSIEKNLIR